MISNIRLTRTEIRRRESRRRKARILGSALSLCLVLSAAAALKLAAPAQPALEPPLIIEAREEPARPVAPPPPPDLRIFDDPVPTEEYPPLATLFADSPTIVPLHQHPGDASPIVGALNPGAVVFGFLYDDDWICIAGEADAAYYVKSAYMAHFSRDMAEISVFADDYAVSAGKFTTGTDIGSLSGMTLQDVSALLREYPGLQDIGESALLYERKYGVNAYFILGVASHESGFGTSPLARSKNNLFGIGAYDDNTSENALAFASKPESVEYFCVLMTVYRENGRTTPSAINERYASDNQWAGRVVSLMNSFSAEVSKYYSSNSSSTGQ